MVMQAVRLVVAMGTGACLMRGIWLGAAVGLFSMAVGLIDFHHVRAESRP